MWTKYLSSETEESLWFHHLFQHVTLDTSCTVILIHHSVLQVDVVYRQTYVVLLPVDDRYSVEFIHHLWGFKITCEHKRQWWIRSLVICTLTVQFTCVNQIRMMLWSCFQRETQRIFATKSVFSITGGLRPPNVQLISEEDPPPVASFHRPPKKTSNSKSIKLTSPMLTWWLNMAINPALEHVAMKGIAFLFYFLIGIHKSQGET